LLRRIAWLSGLTAVLVFCFSGLASARVLLPDCGSSGYGGREEPSRWDYGCTGVLDLLSADWSRWGHRAARARGRTSVDDCDPNCAEGRVYYYRARATASRIRKCRGEHDRPGRFYTRLRLRYTVPNDRRPSSLRAGKHRRTFRLKCPHADTARWRHCGSVRSGEYRARRIRARHVRCPKARAVARHFHDYPIGSSGATYSRGFGCSYASANRVQCGSGADGQGRAKVRWTEVG
jgi:hypothetical protein